MFYLFYNFFLFNYFFNYSYTNKVIARDITISVWGAIWVRGRSNLIFLKDPINPLPFNNKRYIREVLNKLLKS